MNVPVEAQSLSALTGLLAHPPAYPRNPTHQVSEPLVLYIVRVPGSKDVFLSPLKPPTKASISLEAIQSSLYYLHVETEEDEVLKKSIEEQNRLEETERPRPQIQRKPLPPTPSHLQDSRERSISPAKRNLPDRTGQYQDEGVYQSNNQVAGSSNLDLRNNTQRQQLDALYPRSASSFDHPSGDYDVPSPNHFHNHPPLDGEGLVPRHLQSNQNLDRHEAYGGYDRTGGFKVGFDNTHSTSRQNQSTSITLIRRDPVSGGQWNVGRITIAQGGISLGPLNPVSIEITTPGYIRFNASSEMPRPGTGLSDSRAIKEALANGSLSPTGGHDNNSNQHIFTRVADYQQHPLSSRPLRLRHRADSSDSFGKPPSPTKSLRQIYSFTSPWQGICTFINGIDGQSLKCRHTLASSTFTDEDTTVNVAELRFNLPRFVQTQSNDKEPDSSTVPISKLIVPRTGKETFKRGLQHIKNLSKDGSSRGSYDQTSSSDDRSNYTNQNQEPEIDRLSLKLGREKAGGGFKGQSAKLGKLIVENEGLKMCDLVVAACMGVWWQHYEGKSD